ncbi:tRNA1(Val) (adenine(37)-N6)-methyltransferase [Shewanella sp.]|uniref:tRNA1(Val) (adenine(37)-N6)-methyltransferase n=1 Tax=Shewanella sp. TaxID=50422 RepID=UPI003A96A29C
MPFTFKQFHIDDTDCGMPVSTDGVLLGAWSLVAGAQQILDIGAGSGLLSLMAAQRNAQAQIDAVELDDGAAAACQRNFAASPWAARLRLHHCSIQAFSAATTERYALIICNPPYFASGPLASNQARAQARHTLSLPFAELMTCCQQLLAANGVACFIIPTPALADFQATATTAEFSYQRAVAVSSVTGKNAQRQLVLLANHAPTQPWLSTPFAICDQHGEYTPIMRQLTQDFYLKL